MTTKNIVAILEAIQSDLGSNTRAIEGIQTAIDILNSKVE